MTLPLSEPPPLSQPPRFGRALALSVGLHALLLAGALIWALAQPAPPVLLPVDIVEVRPATAARPVPTVAQSAAAAVRTAIDLPSTEPSPEPASEPAPPPPQIRWPDIPVRVKPPRIQLQLSQGLRAPDAPPPIPPTDSIDLERGFRTAPGAIAPAVQPAQAQAGNPPPSYPDEARSKGLQGQVLLRITVSPDGAPMAIALVESSGWAMLDDAAIEAVERWRFKPGVRNGRPETSSIEVPIVFRLDAD